MRIGYVRVAEGEGEPLGDRDLLTAAGCWHLFTDVGSSNEQAPQLDFAIHLADPGDQLVVPALDKLAGTFDHLLAITSTLVARGVALIVLDSGIDTSAPGGRSFV